MLSLRSAAVSLFVVLSALWPGVESTCAWSQNGDNMKVYFILAERNGWICSEFDTILSTIEKQCNMVGKPFSIGRNDPDPQAPNGRTCFAVIDIAPVPEDGAIGCVESLLFEDKCPNLVVPYTRGKIESDGCVSRSLQYDI